MPIPWLTVLQAVPWGEVIRNAPKVAEGARTLWNKAAGPATPVPPDAAQAPAVQPSLAQLFGHKRVARAMPAAAAAVREQDDAARRRWNGEIAFERHAG